MCNTSERERGERNVYLYIETGGENKEEAFSRTSKMYVIRRAHPLIYHWYIYIREGIVIIV